VGKRRTLLRCGCENQAVLYIDGLIRGTLEGTKEEAIFRFGGTDVEVEVAFHER
jgi:hypothetical protein